MWYFLNCNDCSFCCSDSSHFCTQLESALSVVRCLKGEKSALTKQLETIRDDLNSNVG